MLSMLKIKYLYNIALVVTMAWTARYIATYMVNFEFERNWFLYIW